MGTEIIYVSLPIASTAYPQVNKGNFNESQKEAFPGHGLTELAGNEYAEGGTQSVQFSLTNTSVEYIGFGIPHTELALKILHFTFGIVLTFIGVVGLVGNGLVLYVFTRYRRLRGGGVPLILSLAVGDLCMSILHIMPAYSSFQEEWSFGKAGCEFYAAAVGLCGLASLITLSVIAAERFSVIMGAPARVLSSKRACALIWTWSLVLVFPPFVGWSEYVAEGLGTSCSWDYTSRNFRNRVYYIFLLVLGFVVPVSIIVVSYLGILYIVCKQSALMDDFSRKDGLRSTRNDMKTTKVVFCIIICFLISWTPYAICSLIGQFGDASLLSPLATSMPGIFAKSSVIYNPLIYGLTHPLFRTAFADLKSQCLGKHPTIGVTYQSTRRFVTRNNSNDTNLPTREMLVRTHGKVTQVNRCSSGQMIPIDGRQERDPRAANRRAGSNDSRCNNTQKFPSITDARQRFMVEETASVTSATVPGQSARRAQQMESLRKGMWIMKQRRNKLPSYSECTEGTKSSDFSEVSETPEDSNAPAEKSEVTTQGNYEKVVGFMKNSCTLLLVEYRKRRKSGLHQRFFRSENSLHNIKSEQAFSIIFPKQLGTGQELKHIYDDPDSYKTASSSLRELVQTIETNDSLAGMRLPDYDCDECFSTASENSDFEETYASLLDVTGSTCSSVFEESTLPQNADPSKKQVQKSKPSFHRKSEYKRSISARNLQRSKYSETVSKQITKCRTCPTFKQLATRQPSISNAGAAASKMVDEQVLLSYTRRSDSLKNSLCTLCQRKISDLLVEFAVIRSQSCDSESCPSLRTSDENFSRLSTESYYSSCESVFCSQEVVAAEIMHLETAKT